MDKQGITAMGYWIEEGTPIMVGRRGVDEMFQANTTKKLEFFEKNVVKRTDNVTTFERSNEHGIWYMRVANIHLSYYFPEEYYFPILKRANALASEFVFVDENF